MRTTPWRIGMLILLVLSLNGVSLAADPTIYVAAIVTDASEILTEAEIAAVTSPYVGRELTVAQLHEVVAQLNLLYEQKGFLTARAVLPAQTVEQGVVRIRLVEGKVGNVEVVGNKTAAASFYVRRIRLQPGELVRLDRIAQDVGYFNRMHADQVQIQLQPGTAFGTTDFFVLVNPAPDQRVISIDNAGRAETGEYRVAVTYVRQHLLRRGDPLTLSGIWAKGLLAGSAAYQIPLGTRGANLSLGYDASKAEVLTPEFADLEITSRSSDARLTFSYPWLVTNSVIVSSPLELHRKYSGTAYSGVSLTGFVVRTAAAGVDLQWQTAGSTGSCRCAYLVGDIRLAAAAEDVTEEEADEETEEGDTFQKWQCAINGQAVLPGRLMLNWRGAVQGSNGELPSTEKLGMGGAETVRGHAEGKLSGDGGYYVGLELAAPISERLTVSVFADHGRLFPAEEVTEVEATQDDTQSITGYGTGLSLQLFSGLSFKAAYGWSGSGKELHAALQWAF